MLDNEQILKGKDTTSLPLGVKVLMWAKKRKVNTCDSQKQKQTKQRTNITIPLVEPTANVPPSDIKSTDVRGDSAIITLTDLWRNSKKMNDSGNKPCLPFQV